MKPKKTRIGITLPQPYIDALNELSKTGLYLNQGASIREALRNLFVRHGIALEKNGQ